MAMSTYASRLHPLPLLLGLHLREMPRELKGASLGLVVVGDEVLRANDPLCHLRTFLHLLHLLPLVVLLKGGRLSSLP
jgi:hypothetical protein